MQSTRQTDGLWRVFDSPFLLSKMDSKPLKLDEATGENLIIEALPAGGVQVIVNSGYDGAAICLTPDKARLLRDWLNENLKD